MSGPIRPEDIPSEKVQSFPESVFEAFNELIVANIVDGRAMFTQENVIELMQKRGLDRREIFDNGWLNVEEVYREAGWTVAYDKPGYNETYSATFTFRKE